MSSHDSHIGPLSCLPSVPDARPSGRLWRGLRERLNRQWAVGELTIELPSGERMILSKPAGTTSDCPRASIRLHRWRALRRLIFGGEVAFAEA